MDKRRRVPLWIVSLVFICWLVSCDVSHSRESTPDKKKTDVDRCIHIDELRLHGHKAFSTVRLKMRMKTWHSSLLFGSLNCFNEQWLQKDVQSLVELYRKKGYPDVEIGYSLNGVAHGAESKTSAALFQEERPGEKVDLELGKSGDPVPGEASDLESGDSLDLEKDSITIDVEIREGLIYEVVFTGNSFFSERDLKKKIDLVQKGNLNDSALRKGEVAIRQLYLDAGFQEVAVAFRKDKVVAADSGTATWHVEYEIEEGKQTLVNQLVVRGNEKIGLKEIMDAMLTRQKGMLEAGGYNEKVLKKDIQSIELLYLSKGFLNARISNEVKKSSNPSESVSDSARPNYVDIYIDIDEGIQTLVSTARITGLGLGDSNRDGNSNSNRNANVNESESADADGDGEILSEDKLLSLISLKPGQPFREYMIKSDENLLGMLVSEKGYPHVKVGGRAVLNDEKSRADLVWHVDPGQFTRFGTIEYTGNTRLKQDVIEKRVNIIPGEPFSLRKVLVTEKRIRESSAVKSVRIKAPGLQQMAEAPDLEVEIEENMPYFVEAAIGYDTEQTFYLDTKIGDNNFLGREIDAWAAAKISGIGYRTETGLAQPYFWGTSIHAKGNIYAEDQEELNQDFGTKSFGFEVGLTRPLFIKRLTAGLVLKYENRNSYGNVVPEEQDARNILITSFSLGYDSRDSSVRPSVGMLSTASVELFTGFDSDLDRFLKYKIDFRKYISPFSHVTFALRTRLGYIQPFAEQDNVAEDQLFFLGGTSDVRGFKENMLEYDIDNDPAGGRTSANATLEARIELPAQFELNCFWDTGRIDELDSGVESRGFRSSLGIGLRYITPIGPVGLLYGHKLDSEEGEDSGRIHLSVGYTF